MADPMVPAAEVARLLRAIELALEPVLCFDAADAVDRLTRGDIGEGIHSAREAVHELRAEAESRAAEDEGIFQAIAEINAELAQLRAEHNRLRGRLAHA